MTSLTILPSLSRYSFRAAKLQFAMGCIYQVISAIPSFDDKDLDGDDGGDTAAGFMKTVDSMRKIWKIDQLKTLTTMSESPKRKKCLATPTKSGLAALNQQQLITSLHAEKQKLIAQMQDADAIGDGDRTRALKNAMADVNNRYLTASYTIALRHIMLLTCRLICFYVAHRLLCFAYQIAQAGAARNGRR